MCEVMGQLGVAIDGGKDSLSMAARVGTETVKAPGTFSLCLHVLVCIFVDVSSVNVVSVPGSGALVISAYAVCPDITATVTPDLEDPDGKGIAHAHTNTKNVNFNPGDLNN